MVDFNTNPMLFWVVLLQILTTIGGSCFFPHFEVKWTHEDLLIPKLKTCPKPGGKNVPLQKTGRRLGAFWFSLKVLALSIFDFKKELNSNPEKVEKNTPPVAFLAWNTGNNAKKTTFFKLMGH